MWLWFKRWHARLMQIISLPFLRMSGPKLRGLRFRYEKAGLTVSDEPIPWNAEAVLVEAVIRFPPGAVPRKGDFQVRTPDRPPRTAVLLHPDGADGTVRVLFRLPPLQGPTPAAVCYQGGMLGEVALPFLAAEGFVRSLRLHSPTIFALVGKYNVACQALVEGQCRGLSAGGVLASPTSLLPIVDLNLRVEFTDCGTGWSQSVCLPLTGYQLMGNEASLSVVLPPSPRGPGTCSVRWTLGDHLLARAEVRAISPAAFQQSLYLAEGRFLAQGKEGAALFRHHLPARDDTKGLRPCFLIASREPGIAGLCALEVRVLFRDPTRRPLLFKDEVLVTDRPSLCIPDLPAAADFQQIRAFELLSKGQLLGVLPIRPTPVAAFTGEGGFRAAADFDWTPFTEEELSDRLEKLMAISEEEKSLRHQTAYYDRTGKNLALASLPLAVDPHVGTSAPHAPQGGNSSQEVSGEW